MTQAQYSAEQDGALQEWSLRPLALSLLLALAGLAVYFASHNADGNAVRMAFAAGAFFGPLALAFTLAADRWKSALVFASGVGLVMAGIAWRAASAGDRYVDASFWVAAGVLAITLSLPLFQAGFHKWRWRTDYKTTHFHVWTDAITGAGALAFVGLSWALILVLGELFRVIQIDLLSDLIKEQWFGWAFNGATFGAALGVLRNQLKIIGTLQNVVLLVLSILAVPLAIALVIFLLSVLVSGLDVLWEATRSATPLLLSIAVGCFVLANAVVRDDDENTSASRPLRMAGFVLALGILPLSVMASISMGTRIAQHGLSPERLWAIVAIAVAVAYGVGYFVSAIRGRKDGWRRYLRQSNLHLAVLTCFVAFLLAMPVFNFGAISTSNQLSRLESGVVSVEDFDFAALKFDFGDAGRDALKRLEQDDDPEIASLAAEAQALESRPWRGASTIARRNEIVSNVDLSAFNVEAASAIRAYLRDDISLCREGCRVFLLEQREDGQLVVVFTDRAWGPRYHLLLVPAQGGKALLQRVRGGYIGPADSNLSATAIDLVDSAAAEADETSEPQAEGVVELRPFIGQQVYVDGEPVGNPFK